MKRGLRWKEQVTAWGLSSPYVLHFLLITAFPVGFSLVLVFMRWNMLGPLKPVGLRNFWFLLHDPYFGRALLNTLYFLLIHIPLQIVGALILAAVLNAPRLRAKAFFRAVFFLPVVVSGVVVTILWKQLYATETGLLNSWLQSLGLGKVGWLTDPNVAMPAIALMATWKNIGFYVVILLAGLQNIPAVLYEAAALDGAGPVARFFHITLPQLNPTLITVIVLSTIGGFSLFIEPYIMTGGGPLNHTLSVNLYMYQQAFSFYKMGYAATLGFTAAGILFLLVRLQRRFFEREVA